MFISSNSITPHYSCIFRYFELQLDLCSCSSLPLFLHCRNSAADLVGILEAHRDKSGADLRGVVHSFDGTEEEAKSILKLGLYIGLNGWYSLAEMV